jgi:hypothetical protein
MPYRDLWDHKPPGIYLVAAAVAAMPGPTWPWFWAASVGVVTWTGHLIARLAGLMVAVFSVISMALWPLALGGGQTETFAALPAAGAIYAASRRQWLAAGLLCGLATVFSFQAVAMVPALVVLSGLELRALARGAGGFLAVWSAVLIALLATGTMSSAVEVLWSYNRIYLASDRTQDLYRMPELVLPLLPLVAFLPFRTVGLRRIDVAAVAWLITAIVLISLQGRLLPHYVIPLAIPLAVLAGPAALRPIGRRAAIVVTLVVAAFGLGHAMLTYQSDHRGPATEAVARWIRANAGSGALILDWGVDANIYLAAEARPAGRYPYLIPLVTPAYASNERVREWVASLAENPPEVVVDSEAANPYWNDRGDFLRPPPPGSAGGRDIDRVEAFRSWVADNYALVAEVDGRKIYQLRQQGDEHARDRSLTTQEAAARLPRTLEPAANRDEEA